MTTVDASAADSRYEGAGVAADPESTEATQFIQSQLAQWLAHAAVDIGVVARQAREDGDEAIILQVRGCRLPVLLEPAKQAAAATQLPSCRQM